MNSWTKWNTSLTSSINWTCTYWQSVTGKIQYFMDNYSRYFLISACENMILHVFHRWTLEVELLFFWTKFSLKLYTIFSLRYFQCILNLNPKHCMCQRFWDCWTRTTITVIILSIVIEYVQLYNYNKISTNIKKAMVLRRKLTRINLINKAILELLWIVNTSCLKGIVIW